MSDFMDYYNKNGLVDGLIPKGDPCPFVEECRRMGDNCPTKNNPKECDFSCALARGLSILKESGADEKTN